MEEGLTKNIDRIKDILKQMDKKFNNRVKLHCKKHDELSEMKNSINMLKKSLEDWKTEKHLPIDSMVFLTELFKLAEE